VRFPAGTTNLFFLRNVHSIPGDHPASCKMGIGVNVSPGKTPQWREAYHPSLSTAEVEDGAIPPLPHKSS
jgi:hypothetical protein